MTQSVRTFLLSVLLCAGLPGLAQQDPASAGTVRQIVGKAIGKLVVDGTPSQTTTTIFVNSDVVVAPDTHVSLINRGNSLVFTPKSNFQALQNAYRLKSGGSKVATYTGMTAHLPNCYSVTPVRLDTLTQYEVNWSGESAFVYARKQDVRINYWASGEPEPGTSRRAGDTDRGWIVKEGHWARIRDIRLCKPLIDWWPAPNVATAAGLTATTGFAVSIPFWPSREPMSPDHP
ncbi:MAG: hypothetical protein ACXVZX_04700 [Terriglobales bacterium]